ncbi:MAG: hypothetical protein Q4F13_06880 [Pseudomonadota bacterium]|nr:hypothetical protein [Pseudomonadota bacterium]
MSSPLVTVITGPVQGNVITHVYPASGGSAGGVIAPQISADPGNRATAGADGGVYVRDDLVPDPLAYYILAKT